MECPNCLKQPVNFAQWYSGKCYKTQCPHCGAQLVANTGTKATIATIIAMALIEVAAVILTHPEAFANRDRSLFFLFLAVAAVTIIPIAFVLYKKVCGYVLAQPSEI